MGKYTLFFVISVFVYPNAECRSWYNHNREIAYEEYKDPWWYNTDRDSEEGELRSVHHESGYRHLTDWNPDRVWFPDFDKYYPSSSTPSPSKQVVTTLAPIDINECIKGCPTTSEYNPVCGTNLITYTNIGRLECARMCGIDVSLLRKLPCSLNQEPSTTRNTPTEFDTQRQCIESCPTTSEYNPICGTNNVTYQNRGRMECAKACGVDVELKRLSPCPRPVAPHVSATSIDNSRDQATSTEGPDTPKVTISQELLNSIFNLPTTNSNEVDIDIRHGDSF
ncbi:uncharacterized protein [Battus philenor]|uniref:uncharacterized protein n=1 Tax=Battus philenor TaxID=42288 RepID=UPI0035D12821